jgi:ferredoxin
VHLAGDGLCEEVCPEIFQGHDDGLFYVKEPEWPSIRDNGTGPKPEPIYQMGKGLATVPDRLINSAIEAAEDCPGECIMLEFE